MALQRLNFLGGKLIRILISIVSVYAIVVLLVYLGQRYLQYAPNRSYPGKPADYGVQEMEEMRVTAEDEQENLAWYVPPKSPNGKIIIYYHGNAGHIADRAYKIRHFLDAGYGAYLCEYRGYGGNKGDLSEQGIYRDARSALNFLRTQGYGPDQWIIYGESIGSGPAVQMALETQPKGLILEGAFSSAIDVAGGKYPWLPTKYLLKDKYDSIKKLPSIHSSLLMLHGDIDPVIPYALGQKLFEKGNAPKEFVTVKGGQHSNLYDYNAAGIILDWLQRLP